jgi:5S rRNA maturation endonuclease (ribonuclease M5)
MAALGLTMADLYDEPRQVSGNGRPPVVDRYEYVSAKGDPLYEVIRRADKSFTQRRYDPSHPKADQRGYYAAAGCMAGAQRVPFRLPSVIEAVKAGTMVFVCEGEKDVLAVEKAGGVATTNPGGAGRWRREYAEYLRGARVVVVADKDEPGREHAAEVARTLKGVASSVRVVEARTGKDASDHLAAGLALEDFVPMGGRLDGIAPSVNGDAPAEPEPTESPEDTAPRTVRFVPLGEYVAHPKGSPDALLGDGDDVLLPVGGLLMVYADAGDGKTTADLDAVAHLASGTDWLGITVPRPVKVALIQNEGPAEPWRKKLERKLESWTGEPWQHNVLVLDEPHGGFDFRLPEDREAILGLRRQGVELVVADPTKWLGVEGGGTPSEIREFVALLKECGLHSGDPDKAMAFWLAHHENVRGEISGAWRADPDTVVHIEPDGARRTKATWEKCRWSSGRHGQRMILAWADGEGFDVVEIPDRPTMEDDEVEKQVLDFITAEAAEGRRPGMVKVREAVPTRSKRVDEALGNLKERGEIVDLDRKGCPHPGTAGTARYWIPSAHAGLEAVRGVGTAPDSLDFGSQDGERPSAEAVRLSRLKEGQPPRDSLDGTASDDEDWRDLVPPGAA